MKKRFLFLFIFAAALFLSACKGGEPSSFADASADPSASGLWAEESSLAPAGSAPAPESSASASSAPESSLAAEGSSSEAAPPEIPPQEPLLEALALDKANNPRLSETLEFQVSEGKAYLYVSYEHYADIIALQNARLSVTAKGTASFEGSVSADGSVDLTKELALTITDGGVTQRYAVIAERQVGRLPMINIYLDGISVGQIDRHRPSNITFSLDCTGAAGYPGVAECTATIRGRGNSTWGWEKKPFKIKFDSKQAILGLPANKDWILLANYADKSLMRNTVAYDMAKVLDNLEWSPTQIPVDLFINGEYRGVYSIGEEMEVAKSRVNIHYDPDDEDTGMLFEVGGTEDGVDVEGINYFHTKSHTVRYILFKSPNGSKLTEAQRAFAIDLFNKADAAILAGEGYEEYIDIDSFCDWLILHELTNNTDSMFRRSCYLTKEKGGKLKMGPVWDFDLAFGNYVIDNQNYNTWASIGSFDPDAYLRHNWCNYLMQNAAFRGRLKARWLEVRDKLLKAAYDSIDRNAALIRPSQEDNFRVWQIWDIKPGYSSWNNFAANSYEKQVQYLKDFITKRAAWIDENI